MPTFGQYLKEMRKGTGYLATWVPSTPMSLGLYGTVNAGVFTRLGSLGHQAKVVDGTPGIISYSSSTARVASLSATVPPAVAPLGNVDGKLDLAFTREGDFIFHAGHVVPRTVDNLQDVADYMVMQEVLGAWQRDWYFVYELVESGPFVVVLSASNNSQVSLKLKAGATQAALGDIDFTSGVTVTNGHALAYVMEHGQPLYKLARLKANFWGRPGMRPVSQGASAHWYLEDLPQGSQSVVVSDQQQHAD